MKKFLALLSIVGFLLGSAPFSASAEDDKVSFFAPTLQTDGMDRIFSVGGNLGFNFSQLGHWPDMLCKSTKDPICDFSRTQFDNRWQGITASAVLELCTPESNNDCLENVEISHDGTNYKKLTFEKYMPYDSNPEAAEYTYPADPAMDLPQGGRPSIWTETVDGKVSDLKYLVYYLYQMGYDRQDNKFHLNKVSLTAAPFKEKAGFDWASLWTDNLTSGIKYDFRADTNLQITVHMSKEPNGWFKARMKDMDVQILPLNNRNNRLIVKGASVSTPNFAVVRRAANLDATEEKLAADFGYSKGAVMADPAQAEIFNYVNYWRLYLKDIAQYSTTSWSIESTTWSSDNSCLQDKTRVLGIVATNAMGYDGTAPKFVDGFLNYRVTGFHFAADGVTPNLGTYDLLMRSDAARCLYGFSNAPVSATVSITGADGATNVATTVVSERDGWLKMKAAGFTFSEKNIKLKITQVAEVENKVATPVAVVKKRTITCVKGKVTKKVTGVKPACPSGFKKK
jgi:hypothetical protein